MTSRRRARLRSVFDDLVRFETVLWTEIDTRLRRDCNITLGALNVMMIVDATPECRVHDIARALAITVGGTSQGVDRLEAAGWCVRRANPRDRRSSIVALTDAGVAQLRNAEIVFDELLDQLLRAPLSSTEFACLGAALATVRRSASGDETTAS